MICPYCSTDMEPIELTGKVFCSNCGLTIRNNQPTKLTANVISQDYQKIGDVSTNNPEEIQFPVVAEVADSLMQTKEIPENVTSADTEDVPKILEAETPELFESFNPITQATEEEMGISTVTDLLPESVPVETVPEPELESRISDIVIPTESDFESEGPIETPQSYLELANPGNELDTLNASGILLDILSEEPAPKEAKIAKGPRKLKVDILVGEPQNPVEHLELEPADEIDPKIDLLTVEKAVENIDEDDNSQQIKELEKEIADIPEPKVDIAPEDVSKYDPDTIKAKAIKEYFSSALSEVRNQPHKNSRKPSKITKATNPVAKKAKKPLKAHGPQIVFAITLAVVVALILAGGIYYLVTTYVRL